MLSSKLRGEFRIAHPRPFVTDQIDDQIPAHGDRARLVLNQPGETDFCRLAPTNGRRDIIRADTWKVRDLRAHRAPPIKPIAPFNRSPTASPIMYAASWVAQASSYDSTSSRLLFVKPPTNSLPRASRASPLVAIRSRIDQDAAVEELFHGDAIRRGKERAEMLEGFFSIVVSATILGDATRRIHSDPAARGDCHSAYRPSAQYLIAIKLVHRPALLDWRVLSSKRAGAPPCPNCGCPHTEQLGLNSKEPFLIYRCFACAAYLERACRAAENT